jgi:hypothetical protein
MFKIVKEHSYDVRWEGEYPSTRVIRDGEIDLALVLEDGPAKLFAASQDLLEALQRIHSHETRADRRHKEMVDIQEVYTLQRIAAYALEKMKHAR